MIRLGIVLLISFSFFKGLTQDKLAIRQVIEDQMVCWNNGDLECFMQGYWQSEQLVFLGKNGPTYGWESTLARYKENYPDLATMGNLSLEILQMDPLSEEFWFVIGRWKIQRTSGDAAGSFSLIFRKIDQDWLIIADHSS